MHKKVKDLRYYQNRITELRSNLSNCICDHGVHELDIILFDNVDSMLKELHEILEEVIDNADVF